MSSIPATVIVWVLRWWGEG